MDFSAIQNSRRQKNGRIVHEVVATDMNVKKIEYVDIRGGISWPIISKEGVFPFYFCVVGQLWDERSRYEGHKEQKGDLVILCEDKFDHHLLHDEFFQILTDSARKFWCGEFFTDNGKNDEDAQSEDPPFVLALKRFASEHKTSPYIYVKQAPFAEDFRFRVGLIRKYLSDGRLKIPAGSILQGQLRSISDDDLVDENLGRFYAVNALGYVLASFWKCSPDTCGIFTPTRQIRPHPKRGSF